MNICDVVELEFKMGQVHLHVGDLSLDHNCQNLLLIIIGIVNLNFRMSW